MLGLACVFLLQDVNQSGNGGRVFGEILSNCQVNGTPGPAPNNRYQKDALVELEDIRRSLNADTLVTVPSHYRSAAPPTRSVP